MQVQSTVLALSGQSSSKKLYKSSNSLTVPNNLASNPCGVCPVIAYCSDGGVVNPHSCVYLSQWLDMQAKISCDSINVSDTSLALSRPSFDW
jgi:hypothetical protein